MSNRVNAEGESESAATAAVPVPREGTETVECYETDGDVVLYDAKNPLAWIEADTTVTITDAV